MHTATYANLTHTCTNHAVPKALQVPPTTAQPSSSEKVPPAKRGRFGGREKRRQQFKSGKHKGKVNSKHNNVN